MKVWHDLHYQHHQHDGLGLHLPVSVQLPTQVCSHFLNHSDYLFNFFKHWYHKASGILVTVQPCIPFYGYNHKYYWAGEILVLLITVKVFYFVVSEICQFCPTQTNKPLLIEEELSRWKFSKIIPLYFCCTLF